MDKIRNTLDFYLKAHRLKTILRQGWQEVGISCERTESIAEHIYGSLILAIGLESEYKGKLDMLTVYNMLLVKELTKICLDETTTRSTQNNQNTIEVLRQITNGLDNQESLLATLQEFELGQSSEAQFVKQITKIESDIQAKIYDLQGLFDMEKAKADVAYYPDNLVQDILPQMQNASDGWILYDRQYYKDPAFQELSSEIQNLK